MGPGDCAERVPPRVLQLPSSRIHQKGNKDSRRPGKTPGSSDRSSVAAGKSSHPPGPVPPDNVLIHLLPHRKEERPVETHPKFKALKQIHASTTLQDGITASNTSGAGNRVVGGVYRSARRLPSRAHPPFAQEVARFLYKRNSIPVQMPTVRALHGAPDIHKSCEGDSRIPPSSRASDLCLPRRLAPSGTIPDATPRHNLSHVFSGTEARPDPQQGQIPTDPITKDRVPRGNTRLPSRKGLPNVQSCGRHSGVRLRTPGDGPSSSKQVDASLRPHSKHGLYSPVLPPPHEGYSASRSVGVQYTPPPDVEADSQLGQRPKSPTVVDSTGEPQTRTSIRIQTLVMHSHHRRIQDRMGSPFRQDQNVRNMEPQGLEETHQHPRVMGDTPGASPHHPPGQRSQSVGTVRQHVGSELHQQAGRHQKQDSVHANSQDAHVVSSPRDRAPSSPPPGGGEQASRCALQEDLRNPGTIEGQGVIGRVASPPRHMSDDIQQDRETSHRSFRKPTQCATSNVLRMEQRSDGIPSGRIDDELERDQRIRFPSNSPHPPGPSTVRTIETVSDDPGLPEVAQTAVVSEAPLSPGGHSSDSPHEEGSDSSSGESATEGHDSDNSPDCMAAFVQSYRAAGLSQQAAHMAGKARRPSTRKTYNARLRRYYSWCGRKKIDPLQASVKFVGDFLLSVFNAGKSARSIRAHRTAIGAVHLGFADGKTVSNSPALHALVRGIFHSRPPTRSLVPSWDLPTALRLLCEKPYEPMGNATLENLTKKTVFLVAAASGRRVSDIHALSSAQEHVVISSSGARLLPRSGYLAKNQTPDFTPSPIILPDLRRTSNSPDDGPWCPVRALKYYLKRTEDIRGQEDRLFIITKKPYSGASKQTIARWLVDIIKASLSAEDSHNLGSHVSAHSLRSQASAWASYKGASLSDIMDAMGWSSTTTFQTTYLKDVYARSGATAARVLSSATRPTPAPVSSSRSGDH